MAALPPVEGSRSNVAMRVSLSAMVVALWGCDVLARSYAGWHDRWPGSRVDWVLRGMAAFVFVNLLWIASAGLLWVLRRQIHRAPTFAFMFAGWVTMAGFLLWFTYGSNDDDGPRGIGAKWGLLFEPVFATVLWIWLIRCIRPPAARAGGRGFPIAPVIRTQSESEAEPVNSSQASRD